ncbi:MAG: type II secretion system protein [Thermoleophilia bacterium]
MTPPSRRANQAGITLIELVVSTVILGIITTMLVFTWISLQDSYGYSVTANDANSTVRDAVSLMSRALRDAQPTSSPTPTPTGTPTPPAVITVATPTEVDFTSAFNNPATTANGSGTGAVQLMRFYLDTSGSTAQKTLYWQTNNGSGWNQGTTLAQNVVNNSLANTNVTPNTSYTAIFTYWCLDANGNLLPPTDTVPSANLASIISVQIQLIVDTNLNRPPKYADLQTTVSLRNAP